jgi:hypothetical protein
MSREKFNEFAKSKDKKVEDDTVSFSTKEEASDFAEEARRQGIEVYFGAATTGRQEPWHVTYTGPD